MEAAAEQESLQPRPLPEFDVSFRDTLPSFYFHHIIDPIAATLRVEVLGPNLAYTFRHDRAKEKRLPASNIFRRLSCKTTGFLALRTDAGKKRIVLAWAESGHGIGTNGDLLDPEPSALPNDVWAQRVVSVGKMFGLRMNRPYDGRISEVVGRDMSGIFQGGHVEVKLALHAVFVLLNKFGITQDLDNVSLRHLKRLRAARWEDGSKPAFEIYFSRKNCPSCGKFVKTLQKATGIRLKLIWRDRLVKIVYESKQITKTGPTNRPRQPQQSQPQEVIDIDMDDCVTIITEMTEEVRAIDLIDLSRDQRSAAEIINLTGDSCNGDTAINQTNADPSTPTEHAPGSLPSAADAYIDGLAYCVGQIEQCPAGAQTAILELAAKLHQRSAAAAARANINKPLPATPQVAPPDFGAEAALPTPPSSDDRRDDEVNGDALRALLENSQNEQDASSPVRQTTTRIEIYSAGDAGAEMPASASGRQHQGHKRASFYIEIPSRRWASSPDPF
ncbi:hypothetical protein TRIATDRAFT_145507 [Trichoderma atroviride IMI 206040]|uniref:Uncharacterized protein n=1 Tax=Hypocrea atroviridis (strain ATCC 20476 / IMI 206040) TaxID=452589 RepID=G9NL94_HYPAI|nr:uncharacterized protein TRIATDRAFT_145507 [Trichoderma atroviride IMI 206040]EHK48659.1 hypothetical protein TRIATDRAFT_145507 [Trichoderma atroviride IMI 206040]